MKIILNNPPIDINVAETILNKFDSSFIPPLSQRLDLHQYAEKLSKNAVWLLAYNHNTIVGHSAVYMNQKNYAYISSIAVLKEMQKQGIGNALWDRIELEAKKRNIYNITLNVYHNNLMGIQFYKKHSCIAIADENGWFTMNKQLGKS